MLESNFKTQIYKSIKSLFPNAFIQKIADKFTPGIPDMFVIVDGVVTFIELKCAKLRQDGGLKLNIFTQEQIITAKLITIAEGNWLGFIHLEKMGMIVIGYDLIKLGKDIYIGQDHVTLLRIDNGIYDLANLGIYSLCVGSGWNK